MGQATQPRICWSPEAVWTLHANFTPNTQNTHVKGTEISCNTSQKGMQYYLHLVNLQAHVPTLYRSCGHSMPLIGMAVLNSNLRHV